MDLYILRHGIAEERDVSRWPDDSERPLTSKGVRRMRKIAQGLATLDFSFDVIYTSPYERAKRTASIMADVFGISGKLRETEALAVDGDPKELIKLINSGKDEFENVLIVGHEPYLSELASVLLSGDESLLITMKKGAICKLRAPRLQYGKCASLEWFVSPGISTNLV